MSEKISTNNYLIISPFISFSTTLLIQSIWYLDYSSPPSPFLFFLIPFIITSTVCYFLLKSNFFAIKKLKSLYTSSLIGLFFGFLLIYLPNIVFTVDNSSNFKMWYRLWYLFIPLGILIGYLVISITAALLESLNNLKKSIFNNLGMMLLFYFILGFMTLMISLFWGVIFNPIMG